MIDSSLLLHAFNSISHIMEENRDYLISLDQKVGDGDLGLSMDKGFKAIVRSLSATTENDFGKLFIIASSAINETASSTLGTILSLIMIGMSEKLSGKTQVDMSLLVDAFDYGLKNVSLQTGSKIGERTILDSLIPALEILKENSTNSPVLSLKEALLAAEKGVEQTRFMIPVHGRASYFGDKAIGIIDGGAVVGMLIIRGILESSFDFQV